MISIKRKVISFNQSGLGLIEVRGRCGVVLIHRMIDSDDVVHNELVFRMKRDAVAGDILKLCIEVKKIIDAGAGVDEVSVLRGLANAKYGVDVVNRYEVYGLNKKYINLHINSVDMKPINKSVVSVDVVDVKITKKKSRIGCIFSCAGGELIVGRRCYDYVLETIISFNVDCIDAAISLVNRMLDVKFDDMDFYLVRSCDYADRYPVYLGLGKYDYKRLLENYFKS